MCFFFFEIMMMMVIRMCVYMDAYVDRILSYYRDLFEKKSD
jgi:hypothetical protein